MVNVSVPLEVKRFGMFRYSMGFVGYPPDHHINLPMYPSLKRVNDAQCYTDEDDFGENGWRQIR